MRLLRAALRLRVSRCNRGVGKRNSHPLDADWRIHAQPADGPGEVLAERTRGGWRGADTRGRVRCIHRPQNARLRRGCRLRVGVHSCNPRSCHRGRSGATWSMGYGCPGVGGQLMDHLLSQSSDGAGDERPCITSPVPAGGSMLNGQITLIRRDNALGRPRSELC